MATKLELEEYLYRRAIEIIESAESDSDKEKLLFQEVWCPLADLYKDRITAPKPSPLYLVLLMCAYPLFVFIPAHFMLKAVFNRR